MYKGKKILAVIPARGGSKGIPNKNIILLKNKPLLSYSIEVAQQCKYIDKVLVSTDSEKIKEIAEKLNADVPFIRPAALSSDTSRTIDVILHAITQLEKRGEVFDYILLLQPTQPYRKLQHIEEVIKQAVDLGYTSIVSVSEVEEHPLLMRKISEEGKLCSLLKKNSSVRRQDFDVVYKVNGSIYMNKIDNNLNEDTSLNDNEWPYIMDKKYSIDIDTISDLKKAENIEFD